MALTAQDWQNLILSEVGAGLDGNDPIEKRVLDTLTPNLPILWAAWASKALVFPQLQYLYTKRHAIDFIMGQLRDLIQASVGTFSVNQGQKLDNLQKLRDNTEKMLEDFEKKAQANRTPQIATITTVAPIMPRPFQPNPNGRVYRGDPLIPPRVSPFNPPIT